MNQIKKEKKTYRPQLPSFNMLVNNYNRQKPKTNTAPDAPGLG